MCESTVYLTSKGQEREIMRDVILLQPEGDVLLLASLLGERKLIRGKIKRIDFLKHTVHLEESEEEASSQST